MLAVVGPEPLSAPTAYCTIVRCSPGGGEYRQVSATPHMHQKRAGIRASWACIAVHWPLDSLHNVATQNWRPHIPTLPGATRCLKGHCPSCPDLLHAVSQQLHCNVLPNALNLNAPHRPHHGEFQGHHYALLSSLTCIGLAHYKHQAYHGCMCEPSWAMVTDHVCRCNVTGCAE